MIMKESSLCKTEHKQAKDSDAARAMIYLVPPSLSSTAQKQEPEGHWSHSCVSFQETGKAREAMNIDRGLSVFLDESSGCSALSRQEQADESHRCSVRSREEHGSSR